MIPPLVPTYLASCQSTTRGTHGLLRRAAVHTGILVLLLGLFALPATSGEAISKEQMRSLDEQVQEIKSDVLSIAAELNGLEEKLLFPSNTQLSVFVSLAEGEAFRLDSLQVLIDGEPVARHIYSFKELEALKKGGVQRIYTGNVSTGEHRVEASFNGQSSGGKEVTGSQSFSFRKDAEPKLVEIKVGAGSGAASIQVGGW